MGNMFAAAYAYVKRGWPVFPVHWPLADGRCSCGHADCRQAGKHPATAHGFQDATTDLKIVAQWWRQWPEANIGLRTGETFAVLDVDTRHGGADSLRALLEAHGELPDTVMSLTGGGGKHYLFRARGVRNKAALAPGLDVRGEGGYIVAPPSLHASGREYMWSPGRAPGDVEIAPMPGWLHALVASKPMRKGEPVDGLGFIADGERNVALARMAGAMRRQGMSPGAILAALNYENEHRCRPPLDAEEVEQVAVSISRYPPAGEVIVGFEV